MASSNEFSRSDNFFGDLKTERCGCGHRINITDSRKHTCDMDCACEKCEETINRQLRVIEED